MDHLGESLGTTSNIRSHLNRRWRMRWPEGGRCQESKTGVLKRCHSMAAAPGHTARVSLRTGSRGPRRLATGLGFEEGQDPVRWPQR